MKPKDSSKTKPTTTTTKVSKAASARASSKVKKSYLKESSHPHTLQSFHNAYITALSQRHTMPFNSKKRKTATEEDVDDVPTTKRGKAAAGNAFQPSAQPQVDSDGNKYWEISKARRVTISKFNGKTLVNIREYYEKDGQWLPGKKGISMSIEQYSALITIMPQVEDLLKSQGETIPRPKYTGQPDHEDDDQEDEDEEMDAKPNIDATSDEDE